MSTMPLLNRLLHLTNHKSPFLRTLLPSIYLSYGIQAAVAVPSILAQSERFYDLSGSLTYISCTALSLYLPTLRARAAARAVGGNVPAWPSLVDAFKGKAGGVGAVGTLGWNWRQVGLSLAAGLWAARLGSYLFTRILSDGKDSRFEKIRNSPPKFAVAFFAQATWVSLVLLPVLAINSLPPAVFASLPASVAITDIIGALLWTSGFAFEVTADRQKSAWSQAKKEKKHDEDFLTSGLYSKSRFPNYFGESTLWTGVATLAAGILTTNTAQVGMGLAGWGILGKIMGVGMAAASPAFTTFLLLKVSGVPMSEGKYDKRYGGREDYQRWKKEVPRFFPKLW